MQRIAVYETTENVYLIGSDPEQQHFRVLMISRAPIPFGEPDSSPISPSHLPTVENESLFDLPWRLSITEFPKVYTQSSLKGVLHCIHEELQNASNTSYTHTTGSKSAWFKGVFRKKEDRKHSTSSSLSTSTDLSSPTHLSSHEFTSNSAPFDLGAFPPTMICHGVAGVVRFLRGYYLILITKCRLVAQLGEHNIFKVEDTCTIYIPGTKADDSSNSGRSRTQSVSKSAADPSSSNGSSAFFHHYKHAGSRSRLQADELRYLKLFNTMDLNNHFYFSYTYDLSHSLQFNMKTLTELPQCNPGTIWAVRQSPDDRFVWNWRLIPLAFRPDRIADDTHPEAADWFLLLFHGTVIQTALTSCGLPIYLTLIGRRSRHYAGTRFLKRGANLAGDVANEVETEQIVHNTSHRLLRNCVCSSYVQMRGSVPLFWSQEPSKVVVGRPPVELVREDPYFEAFGRHFANLLKRHGSPIVALNLMKKHEKRRFELPLSERYEDGLAYLSQFLPSRIAISNSENPAPESETPSPPIIYIAFDISRVQKHRRLIALDQLRPVVDACIRRTGIFIHSLNRHGQNRNIYGVRPYQCGLIRMNCMDCLDRTNTAQFVVGRVALAYQLYNLGFLAEPVIESDSSAEKLLQKMYDEHGDTLALQYAGSQLVHNINTYKKNRKLTSQSRDFMQTISRYYSNKFSDWDKQCVINLFLRTYRPIIWPGTLFQLVCEELYQLLQRQPRTTASVSLAPAEAVELDAVVISVAGSIAGQLWDVSTDTQLHWLDSLSRLPTHRAPLTDWCSRRLLHSLPRGLDWYCKKDYARTLLVPVGDARVNWSSQLYRLSSYESIKHTITEHLRWSELSTYPLLVEPPSPGGREDNSLVRRITLTSSTMTPTVFAQLNQLKAIASVPNLAGDIDQIDASKSELPESKDGNKTKALTDTVDESSSDSEITDIAGSFLHIYPHELTPEFTLPTRRDFNVSHDTLPESDSPWKHPSVFLNQSNRHRPFDPNPLRLKPADVAGYQNYLSLSPNFSRPAQYDKFPAQITPPSAKSLKTYQHLVGLSTGGDFSVPKYSLAIYQATAFVADKLRC